MRCFRFAPVGLFVALALAVAAQVARADDEKIPLDKVPKVVKDAVTARWPMAQIKHASKTEFNGKAAFELGFNADKAHLHAIVTPEGKVVEIHSEIDIKDLPAKVTAAIKARYAKGKVEEAEQLADPAGKVRAYEVVVRLDAATLAILEVTPEGKIGAERKVTEKK